MDRMRELIAGAVRGRVAGPGGADRQRELFDTPGPRWFVEGSPIHRVHGDVSMFVGGLRAILLQSLHPLAMAGVAEHSDYKADPWGRLRRTADFLAATTFGPDEQAVAACATVRRVHTRVRGVAPDGRPYSANDPHLLRWVHVAEVDSFLAAHDRYGAERLGPRQRDRYVADMARIAVELGVPDPPRDVASLRRTIGSYRHELAGTPAAREAARFLLAPPLPPVAIGPYAVLGAAAVGLLPVWARRPLRLPWLPLAETFAVRPAGHALVAGLRWALVPTRRVPPAA
jgi:uncharacterized protein (DUF2236 family)